MKMARLSDHPTQGGKVIDWTPTQSTLDAMTTAPATGVTPSLMQITHLALAKGKAREGFTDSSWLCSAFELEGPFDVDAWTNTVNTWVARHGGLRNWFTLEDDDEIARHELPPDQVAFEPSVFSEHVTPTEMLEHVHAQFDIHAVPLGRLGYTFTAVVGDDKTVMYFGGDHSYLDGFSVLLLFWELNTLYDCERAGTVADLPPVGSYPDYCVEERALADTFELLSPGVQYWLEFAIKGGGALPTFPLDLGIPKGVKVPCVPVYTELLDNGLDVAYEAAVKDLGGTFPAGLYAACAMAAHEMGAATSYRFLNPVHSRWSPEWIPAMGWFVNLVPLHIDIEPDDTFASLAQRVRQVFKESKVAGEVPTLRVIEIINEFIEFSADSADRPPIVSYLDGNIIPGHERWDIQNSYGLTGAGDDDDVYQWINRMPGHTYVTCSCPGTPQAVHAVQSFFQRAAEILQQVAITGADVPMGPAGILEPPAA